MPLIGLLSDSHGRADTTAQAVAQLVGAGATMLLHLGDVGSEAVLEALVVAGGDGQPIEAHVVFGNTDGDIANLSRHAHAIGVQVDHPVGRIALTDGRELLFLHGHDSTAMFDALDRQPAYLCHGHSHQCKDVSTRAANGARPTRVINPGALVRARRYTVALLDTDADSLRFFDIGGRC